MNKDKLFQEACDYYQAIGICPDHEDIVSYLADVHPEALAMLEG